jgi:DNA-directed RNA polymerase subunit M/transcription elongation factor TFIIS
MQSWSLLFVKFEFKVIVFNLQMARYNATIALSYAFYENEKYNALRRGKISLFSTCFPPQSSNNLMHNQFTNNLRDNIGKALKGRVSKAISHIVRNYVADEVLTTEKICVRLERGCLNRALAKARDHNIRAVWENDQFQNVYHSVCYKVVTNLDVKSAVGSTFLNDLIISGQVVPDDVANMTCKELCPARFSTLDKKIKKRLSQEIKIKYSTLYRCGKCKARKCTTTRVYNRSLDEGVNLRIRCIVCGNEWGG